MWDIGNILYIIDYSHTLKTYKYGAKFIENSKFVFKVFETLIIFNILTMSAENSNPAYCYSLEDRIDNAMMKMIRQNGEE